jgi:hypothetical protein
MLPRSSATPDLPRLLVATVVAPTSGCLFGLFSYAIGNALLNPPNITFGGVAEGMVGIVLLAIYGIAYGCGVGMAAMIVFGLPIHAALVRLNLRHLPAYALGGIPAGAAAPFLFTGFASVFFGGAYTWRQALSDGLNIVPLGAWLGACVLAVFWLIRRPDRDAANPPTPAP